MFNNCKKKRKKENELKLTEKKFSVKLNIV